METACGSTKTPDRALLEPTIDRSGAVDATFSPILRRRSCHTHNVTAPTTMHRDARLFSDLGLRCMGVYDVNQVLPQTKAYHAACLADTPFDGDSRQQQLHHSWLPDDTTSTKCSRLVVDILCWRWRVGCLLILSGPMGIHTELTIGCTLASPPGFKSNRQRRVGGTRPLC